jgi:Bacterial Ig domain/Beta xylosidase C-terminal Concanavalin A-like domain/Fibronectin type III domain
MDGTFGRFRYFPAINTYAVVDDAQQNAFTLKLSASTPPPPTSTPVISAVNAAPTSNAVTITWTTDVPSTSQVEDGTSTSYGTMTPMDSNLVTSHSVAISGLTSGSTYHYRVRSKNSSGTESMSSDSMFATVTSSPPPSGTTHLDFNYADRNALLNAGWSYTATTAAGGQRNTEQLSGTFMVSYDQSAHPGTIRIPVGSGEIWHNMNNSQNMLVHALPSNWTSIRLKVAAFNPTARDQEVGLLAYQDDDNYVSLNRLFGTSGSVIELFRESAQATTFASKPPITNTGNLILRLDRNSTTYTAMYSADGGTTWTTVGSTTASLNNPRLAIQVGGNTSTTIPTADLAWTEMLGAVSGPVISVVAATGVSQGGANISWSTDVLATSQVEYGTTTAYGLKTPLDSALVTSHMQTLSGLASGTVYHFRVRSKDSSGTETLSNDATFTTLGTKDTTPPTVSIMSPSNGSSTSGTITVTAAATDDVGVVGVQFMLDGAAAGQELTTPPPYSISWNSTTVPDGQHTMAARARDAAGNIATSSAITINVANGSSVPVGSDFQSRCQSAGVIRCWSFDDAAATNARVAPPYGSTTKMGQVVNDVVADGSGALRFTVPSQSGADTSGNFSLNFADDFSQQFGEGQEFYIQYRVRYNDVMVNTHFNNSNGFKMNITGEGDRPGSTAYSCTTLEVVLENTDQAGFPQAYHSCGTFQRLQVHIPNTSEYLDQNADGCPHYGNQGFLQTEPPCFKYKANEWITIQQHVKIGHWGQPDSTVEFWAADQGQTSRLIISLADFTLLNDNPSQAKYGKIWLLPYQTNKDSSQVTGTGYVWYDDLIISRSRIPDPDVTTPNAPDLLRAVPMSTAGAIQLSWRDNSGGQSQGFKIERCADVANSCMARPNLFTSVKTVGSNVTSWQDSGLTSGQFYTYRVKAFNAAGDSASSGGACFNGGNPCYSETKPN